MLLKGRDLVILGDQDQVLQHLEDHDQVLEDQNLGHHLLDVLVNLDLGKDILEIDLFLSVTFLDLGLGWKFAVGLIVLICKLMKKIKLEKRDKGTAQKNQLVQKKEKLLFQIVKMTKVEEKKKKVNKQDTGSIKLCPLVF